MYDYDLVVCNSFYFLFLYCTLLSFYIWLGLLIGLAWRLLCFFSFPWMGSSVSGHDNVSFPRNRLFLLSIFISFFY